MSADRSVRFGSASSLHEYEAWSSEGSEEAVAWQRDSQARLRNERRVVRQPRAELETFRQLVLSWRDHATTVVLGNLGRQPHLLTYFLDLCFSHEDDVRVECAWPIPTPYQTGGGSHFLVVVEPAFGDCVRKPASTEHLVVLTSHLNLDLDDRPQMRYYHLPTPKNAAADPTLPEPCEGFTPPLFHGDRVPVLPPPDAGVVLFDLSRAKSLHEAYLRLLTGREMIGSRRFKLRMDPRKRLDMLAFANETRRRAEQEYFFGPLDTLYWHGIE